MIAAILLVLQTAAASASPVPSAPPLKILSSPRVQARSHSTVGRVVSLDEERRLTLETPEGTKVVFPLGSGVRVMGEGRSRNVQDIVPGTAVMVACQDTDSGEHRPRLVRVLRSLPSPRPSPAS